MKLLYKFFKGNEKNLSRECFLWNSFAGGVNAAEAVVLMLIITRTNGLEAAGMLSIAFAVGNLLMTVGKYSVRNFQVTDVNNVYSFGDYFTLRIVTTSVMLLLSIAYVFVKVRTFDYTVYKAFIVLGVCFIFVIESFEEVFLGFYQKEGRLDISSKVFILRWLLIMICFSVISALYHNLLLAIYISAIMSFVCEFYLIYTANKFFPDLKLHVTVAKLWDILKQCFALFLSGFMMYYVTSAPKYAIDQYLTEDIQAYYGYISMPVFVVELLNCFLYQPQMVSIAENWNAGLLKMFNKQVIRQTVYIIVLTIICTLGAYILGIPVLSILYGVDLSNYKLELMVLMLSGGMLAFVGFTTVLLTILRQQKLLLCNMLFISGMAFFGFGSVVKADGILGATKYYLLLMFILSIINYCCIILIELRKKCRRV